MARQWAKGTGQTAADTFVELSERYAGHQQPDLVVSAVRTDWMLTVVDIFRADKVAEPLVFAPYLFKFGSS